MSRRSFKVAGSVGLALLLGCAVSTDDVAGTDPSDCPVDAGNQCPRDTCSLLQGLRLDVATACISERKSFCLPGGDVDELVTIAVDPEGGRWYFGSTTIPSGWTSSEMQAAEADADAWSDCQQ